MRSHVKSASIELWRIIEVGFKAVDPTNMTRREVVDCQLNDLALNMIQTAVGEKHISHIEPATTAKEAWDTLTQEFFGNESMKKNRFEALSNQAEGFFMIDGEDQALLPPELAIAIGSHLELPKLPCTVNSPSSAIHQGRT